jgi:hypothetical protein
LKYKKYKKTINRKLNYKNRKWKWIKIIII